MPGSKFVVYVPSNTRFEGFNAAPLELSFLNHPVYTESGQVRVVLPVKCNQRYIRADDCREPLKCVVSKMSEERIFLGAHETKVI